MAKKVTNTEMSSEKIISTLPENSIVPADIGALYQDQGRYFFKNDKTILELPGLIEVQLDSYRDFMDRRIGKAFSEIFPIDDFTGEKISIHYKGYRFEEPKYTIAESKRKNLNYEAPLKVKFEMLNKISGEIKEQEVYMGGIPLMTEMGTFVVNGVERVIVNQIIRSTGIFFTPDAKHVGLYGMKVIPQRGSWFEIEVDKKGFVSVKIDKKRKIPVSVLLRAWGYETDADIINAFK
jgi:DNA-directed RNA polymerase subunit beta